MKLSILYLQIMENVKPILRLSWKYPVIVIIIFPFLAQCQNEKAVSYNSPPGYDLTKPEIIPLPKELKEISGLCFDKSNSLYAISDDKGSLFKIDLDNPKNIESWKFDKPRNYEDIFLLPNQIFILNSNGDILVFEHPASENPPLKKYDFPFGKGEFEVLYYDQAYKKLILICKECEKGKKDNLSVYTFDPEAKKYEVARFAIDVNDIAAAIGKKSFRFKPSAATIQHTGGDVFIVSSINKLLVTTQSNGKIKDVYHLDPAIFKQPEGIAFTPAGDMIISNESTNKGPANLLIFRYQKH